MVTVPADPPVTIPVLAPALAMVVLLLLHVPPVVVLLSVVVEPIHTEDVPLIAAGNGFTVMVFVTLAPQMSV